MSDQRDTWRPIAAHGLVGDLRTCALVGTDGTIDWFCAGRFDSPSVFGSILDPDAGEWRLAPPGGGESSPGGTTHQFYLPDSNILITRFLTEDGVAEVQDFMPVLAADDADHRQRIVRRVVGVRGTTAMEMRLAARPDYGRATPEVTESDHGLLLAGDGVRLGLVSSVDLHVDGADVTASWEVATGDEALFVLEVLDPDSDELPAADADETDRLFERTAAYWRDWLSQSTYTGRWREMVNRSALTLKLLTHEPTGAIIAAPTTSLPEEIGGERNWDYRFVWIRDAAFSLYALLRLGFTDEAARFMEWLSQRLGEDHDGDLGPLRVAYDIDGNVPEESELDHLRGYRDSQPVRVGNAAMGQLQLDIYGELIDSVYLFNKYGPGISHDAWTDLCRVLTWVMDNWERDDAGMWEIRDEPRPHTTSRLMCWVAVERMMRTARQRGLPGDVAAWSRVRDAIYTRIQEHSWDDEVGAYMQSEGSDSVDAGVLLMPMVKFVAPNDPRFVSTLKVIEERLVSDSLVFRYDVEKSGDGVDGQEGTFSLCSFWYVEALTRVGRLDEARLALEKMFTYANHLGLFAEQVGLTGEQLGNFPQAFTHLSLISAATNLDGRLG
ncbi:glycoside hydrolase family 15 protein [Nocardioides sp. C4-1]|uniref:glycoside hydrolase family 15 protein n=1 Tax=Nocardioides sp. C4-1 TaxID=3151851 RepID=UPI0032663E6C